jgi:hypothetical protein
LISSASAPFGGVDLIASVPANRVALFGPATGLISMTNHLSFIGVFSVAAATLLGFACGDLDPELDEKTMSTLIGGTSTTPKPRPEVGQIRGIGCTATLIAPHFVLTSARCFDFAPTVVAGRNDKFEITNGSTKTSYTITKVRILGSRAVGSPTFAVPDPRELQFTPAGRGNDSIAVAKLSQDVPATVATPARLAIQFPPLNVDTTVTAMGHGCASRTDESITRSRHWATYRYPAEHFTPRNCGMGDQGAPRMFGGPADGREIWAIGAGHFFGNEAGDLLADVPWFREQILEEMRQMDGLPYEIGFDRPGADLGAVSAVGTGECRHKCIVLSNCRAYTFSTALKTCWLKRAVPNWVPAPGMQSGVVPAEEDGYNRPAGTFDSFDMSVTHENHASGCRSFCDRQRNNCVAWAFDKRNSMCHLKSGVSPAIADPNFVSGRRVNLEGSTDRPGSDYRTFVADSTGVTQCAAECSRDAACRAFTHSTTTNTCHLKQWASPPVFRGGFTSALKRGVVRNEDRRGFDKARRVLADDGGAPETCQALCYQHAGTSCEAWAYVPYGLLENNALCFMKHPYVPGASPAEGVMTGLVGSEYY